MIKSYLLVTYRNLLKNRVFTLINILGLGIALSVCIVAFFNHMFNYEFDRNNENFDNIFRVTSFRDMENREQEYGIVPATLGLEVKKDIPGIEKSARLVRAGLPVKKGDDLFPMQISFVDPEFLDIFTFPIINGDKKSIEGQGNALISLTTAITLFGAEYPIGKTVSFLDDRGKEFTFTVGAVFEDLPEILDFIRLEWKNLAINEVFGGMTQEDTMEEEKDINGSILKVNMFLAIVATLLSLIGMYNLVSLDIIRRTKEMGVRKIQGAPIALIMYLISKKFLIVLVLASVIGCLGGYYLSMMLLDSIWDYFVKIGAGILISAVLIMFIATIFTIIFKIFRAAMRNPVDSLRYE